MNNDEVMRITEKLSNFLSNEIAAMTRDERLFTPRDMENAVYQGIRAAYEAGEIAMKEKAAKLCEREVRPELDNFNDLNRGWNEALTYAAKTIRAGGSGDDK